MTTQHYEEHYGSIHSQPNVMNEKQTSGSVSPLQKPLRSQSMRVSNGTVSTNMSFSTGGTRMSDATNITQPVAYSKKIVVVGDGGCGKTCFLSTFSHGEFPEKYVPTVFENWFHRTTHKPSGKEVELALWDTAGQEEYDRLRPLSYPDTDLLFICFAIDCPNSLESVMDKWYAEVTHFCPTTPLILVGLKSDLRHNRKCIELLKTQGLTPVSQDQGRAVASQIGAQYIECSSKEMRGLDEAFDLAVNTIVGLEDEGYSSVPGFSTGGGGRKIKKQSCKFL